MRAARRARPLPARRLAAQQLRGPRFDTPAALVGWLVAMQAQEPAAARWAVGLRLRGRVGEGEVEAALAAGAVLRTHALRGTWHLVTPPDLRDLLALSAPRVHPRLAARHRQLGLDPATRHRALDLVARALEGGHRTRAELRASLEAGGVGTGEQRLSHLLLLAELEALACSGAPRGGQPTWAAFEARVPARRGAFDREAALAGLALRYVRGRGPAGAGDLAWWAGAGVVEARRALEACRGPLQAEEVDGRTLWSDPAAPAARAAGVDLLPAFDEYLVAYRDRDAVLAPRHARRVNAGGGLLDPIVVHGGQVVGTWRRELTAREVRVAVAPFEAPGAALRAGVASAARRYGAFLGLEPALSWRPAPGR